jgi:hypothetical protein
MAKILYCWELGAGAGHLVSFRPIAEKLLRAGHELTLVVKNTQTAIEVFGNLPCRILPAPTYSAPKTATKTPAMSFSQVLMECGYSDPSICSAMLRTWHDLVNALAPDLVIANHAPAVLIVTYGLSSIQKTAFGTGFTVPPADAPIPPWNTPFQTSHPEDVLHRLLEWEDQVTHLLNKTLHDLRLAPIPSIGATMGGDCLRLLSTYSELDPYLKRTPPDQYLGSWSTSVENECPPKWDKDRIKIFAYLRHSKGLGHLLDEIKRMDCSAILVVRGMNTQELQRIASPTMQFVEHLVCIPQVIRECDIAIVNASHGTTCDALLAGKPILQLPRNMEQLLTAANTDKLGASLTADPQQGESIVTALRNLLASSSFRQASEDFASRYSEPKASEIPSQIAEKIQCLL